MPANGTEVWADGMGSCPGGIANLAIASSRLGLRTSLAAAFGDDDYADFCWRTLAEQEHVDLQRSRRFERWHSPVTVSMAVDRDRSMVTHGHAAPMTATEMIGRPPRSRAVFVDLDLAEPLGTSDRPTLGRPGPRRGRAASSPTWAGTPPAPGPATVLEQLVGLPRVPAQRRRGDGLHPHRHRRTTRSTPSPTGCRSRW